MGCFVSERVEWSPASSPRRTIKLPEPDWYNSRAGSPQRTTARSSVALVFISQAESPPRKTHQNCGAWIFDVNWWFTYRVHSQKLKLLSITFVHISVVWQYGNNEVVGRSVVERRFRQHAHVLRFRQYLPKLESGESVVFVDQCTYLWQVGIWKRLYCQCIAPLHSLIFNWWTTFTPWWPKTRCSRLMQYRRRLAIRMTSLSSSTPYRMTR